ncbi:serine/threonine protein kinase [Parageobacillus thermoglucosidasius]|uniref:serine/threonine protein kinase n=1 Tax=Parageobacillus thermoglucosidasius TaxID=1426 RepID=UPI000E19512F|nr:serine/threonine-protein kinase [Parageobacillus thermoglucosidasius]RDE31329.1 serine/threonine protein kinase [Parageobacillus thermoglucosidasius]
MRLPYFFSSFARLFERRYRKGHLFRQRYRIVEELGMGSYGIAYLANDLQTGRNVVVKQGRTRRNISGALFQREAAILRRLQHPQIPKWYDTFVEEGIPHLVMEYKEGDTVETLIFDKGHTYTEHQSFCLLRDVLEVVAYIHAKGVVHRDLRIPNILLCDGTVFIIDFGLARFFGEPIPHLETYVLEKQLRRETSAKSDFYALGHFTLFLLYSSYEPVTKEEKSWEEELPLSAEARCILRKMLQIDRPYDNIAALIRDVDQLLGGEIAGKRSIHSTKQQLFC